MYPHVTKEMPSAPPSYFETVGNTQQQAPPNPGLYTQQQAPPPVQAQVIVVQTGIPPLGPRSVQLVCPSCKLNVRSRVDEESSTSAYLCCMLLCLIQCYPCACIPFCMDSFMVYKHSCPNCGSFIGKYQQS